MVFDSVRPQAVRGSRAAFGPAPRSLAAIAAIAALPAALLAGGVMLADSLAADSLAADGIGDLPPPEVSFFIDTVDAVPGGTAQITVSVLAAVPLRSISVALDFDESMLRATGVVRLPPDSAEPVPADGLAATAFSNLDKEPGNQTEEGWVFAELASGDPAQELGIPVGEKTAILGVEFRVHARAPAGFTPVRFAVIRVSEGGPSPVYATTAAAFDSGAPNAGPVPIPEGNLANGGVKIIGEIGFFMRADSNWDQLRDIADPIFTLGYLFNGGFRVLCLDSADANDDGLVDVSDAVYTLSHLFLSPGPFPAPEEWGKDPTPDSLGCASAPPEL